MNVQATKDAIDCRELIAADLGKPATGGSLSSKWWKWLCPFHQEKTPSFTVTAESWYCFGCNKHGDAITWLTDFHKMEFKEAMQHLGAGQIVRVEHHGRFAHAITRHIPRMAEPPAQFQEAFQNIVTDAENFLWGDHGQRALVYLQARGFERRTMRMARLGYIPGQPWEYNRMHGHSMPCGILIPWIADGAVWGIKVRRAAGDTKYNQVAGGNVAGCLYLADDLCPSLPALIVEGEFNALAAWQAAADLLCPVSLGSASSSLNVRWMGALAACHPIIAIYDKDQAGEKARARLSILAERVKFVTVPDPHKDLNDWLKADESALRKWLESVVK